MLVTDIYPRITNKGLSCFILLDFIISLSIASLLHITLYLGGREFDINEKSELYGEYFEQFNNQRNSFLFDQKLRENLKVNIKNLSPTES